MIVSRGTAFTGGVANVTQTLFTLPKNVSGEIKVVRFDFHTTDVSGAPLAWWLELLAQSADVLYSCGRSHTFPPADAFTYHVSCAAQPGALVYADTATDINATTTIDYFIQPLPLFELPPESTVQLTIASALSPWNVSNIWIGYDPGRGGDTLDSLVTLPPVLEYAAVA